MAVTPEQRAANLAASRARQQEAVAARNVYAPAVPQAPLQFGRTLAEQPQAPLPALSSFSKAAAPKPLIPKVDQFGKAISTAITNAPQDFNLQQPTAPRAAPTVPTPAAPVKTLGAEVAAPVAPTAKDVFVKRAMGKELTPEDYGVLYDEQMKAQEKATLESTGYQAQIDLQNKQAAEAQAAMDAQKQTILSDEEKQRQAGYESINANFDQQIRTARELGTERQGASQQAFSFSGFGRSTANAAAIDRIGAATSQSIQTLEASKAAQKAMLDAQLRGASSEQMKALGDNLNALQTKAKQLEVEALGEVAKLNQENGVKGAEALANLMKTISPTEQPGKEIDAASSKLLGKMIYKDGTFVKDANGQPVTFELAEEDKSKYQSQFNPLTGEQVIFNPTTGQIVQKIGSDGRVSGGMTDGSYVPGSYPGFSGGADAPKQGFRTDRNNNPAAFTTDIAKQAGLIEGVDFTYGDVFPDNPNLFTARLIGDPVAQTIKVIDRIGFFNQSGQPRWTHTALPQQQWNSLNAQQKKEVVKEMYKKEGGSGSLFGAPVVGSTGLTESEVLKAASAAGKNIDDPKERANILMNAERYGIVPDKKPSELNDTQRKAMGYADRLTSSNDVFDQLSPKITSLPTATFLYYRALPSSMNFLLPPEVQQQFQAEKNFVNAKLRVESGAAIAQSEFDNATQQYFPAPGDSPQVLAQKKANRDQVIKGMLFEAGQGSTKDFAGQQNYQMGSAQPSQADTSYISTLNLQ